MLSLKAEKYNRSRGWRINKKAKQFCKRRVVSLFCFLFYLLHVVFQFGFKCVGKDFHLS